MNNQTTTKIFVASLKSILQSVFKLCLIAFVWCIRLAGLMLTKTGEAIERIMVKKN